MKSFILRYRFLLAFVLICVIVGLSRLPYILSDNFILNGDQSILGIMAMEASNGNYIPGFFMGQSYGLASFETIPLVLMFSVFGESDYVLVSTNLLLFSLAIFFLFRLLETTSNNYVFSLLGVALIAVLPGTYYLSLGAYPLYVSSILFALLAAYYLIANESRYKWYVVMLASLLSFYIHPIFIVGVVPLLIYRLWKERFEFKSLLGPSALSILVLLGILLLKSMAHSYWSPEPFGAFSISNYTHFLDVFNHVSTGWYYLESAYSYPVWTRWASNVSLFVVGLGMVIYLWRLIQDRTRLKPYHHLLVLGLMSYLVIFGFMKIEDGHTAFRYMSPLLLWGLIFATLQLQCMSRKYLVQSLLVLSTIVGIYASSEFDGYHHYDNHEGKDRKQIKALISYLDSHGVNHAYSTGALVQWQVMFYSRLDIVVRFDELNDRNPSYIHRVEDARLKGGSIAVIGKYGHSMGMEDLDRWHQKIQYFAPSYFALINPDWEMLKYGGYELRTATSN